MKQPDPTSLYKTLDYIEDQSSMGNFKGSGSSILVLIYLAKNSWRSVPNNENAPLGAVLSGKSGISKISEGTALSKNTVRRSLDWLSDNGWIKRKPIFGSNGRQDWNQYRTLLDQGGHELRDEIREMNQLHEEMGRVPNWEGEGANLGPYEGSNLGPPNKE